MHPEDVSLHQMNPLQRFSDRASDYARYRPSYPAAAIDKILAGLTPSDLVAADVGAGTGISARLLAERGVHVYALEPNQAMRLAATPHPLVTFFAGTAEQTELPYQSLDLVTCFQSFHWFSPQPTLWEFQRILKPSGRLALIWNHLDPSDPFTGSYRRLLQIASNHHPAMDRHNPTAQLLQHPRFGAVEQTQFTNWQNLDWQGLLGRMQSTSYVPKQGPALEQLLVDLSGLYAQFANAQGLVSLVLITQVYLSQTRESLQPDC
ncbi:methyltransferase type 11 [Neosynechococcus sphagnicola sy1]|uniref:Methyltransferase type 11 n=1 Tax=Neosynechococcus sphagnicola sy1 TaxID=1497020 RepID=A0A098TMV7_9CYAN|nr:class I SAM-dependent methyltransferase [Neosynechococcus sphagnicola]KGF73665.1 methyltransferase type 11 [Neosynechococcus sphagnicola sy1]